MEKLYTSKTFSIMAGGRRHTSDPTPLDPPLAISYKSHQISPAYFSRLAPLVLLFVTKNRVKRGGPGGGGAQCTPSKYAPDSTSSTG